MQGKCLSVAPEVHSLNKHLFLRDPGLGAEHPVMSKQSFFVICTVVEGDKQPTSEQTGKWDNCRLEVSGRKQACDGGAVNWVLREEISVEMTFKLRPEGQERNQPQEELGEGIPGRGHTLCSGWGRESLVWSGVW